MGKAHSFFAPLLFLILPAYLPATTIVTDQAQFLSEVAPGYYLENFNGLSRGSLGLSHSFSGSGFSYTVSAPSGVWISMLTADRNLTNVSPSDALTFNFGPGVTAVGGSFATTNILGALKGGSVVLTLSDGTVQTISTPSAFGFAGFYSTTGITSLTVSGTRYLAIDNLYVGSVLDPVATPEPASMALAAAGCVLVVLLRRRRSA